MLSHPPHYHVSLSMAFSYTMLFDGYNPELCTHNTHTNTHVTRTHIPLQALGVPL